jgi:hypothetical protein
MKNKGGKPRHNLLGRQFGHLLVISQAPNIISGKRKSQKSAWNCQCECGAAIIVSATTLLSGTKSCGCQKNADKRKLKPGQVFHYLTTLSFSKCYWTCQCKCGKTTKVKTNKLTSGHTRSCGCLQSEIAKQIYTGQTWSRKYLDPKDKIMQSTWRGRYDELPFDDFCRISQLDCYYCLIPPSNHRKWDNGISFDYNGLDRIDSNKSHTINNIVPCCWICNRAKRERTIEQFIDHIDRLITSKPQRIELEAYRQLHTTIDLSPLIDEEYREIVHHRTLNDYDDGNLSIEQFYRLSQLDCYYCGTSHLNSNFFRGRFRYNGLDRLDSTLPHDFENCIPSCKYCNYSKQGMTLLEFDEWINRLERRKIEQGFTDLIMLSEFAT